MPQVISRFALALMVVLAGAGVARATSITVYTDRGGGHTLSGFDLGGEELSAASLTADSVNTSYAEHAFLGDALDAQDLSVAHAPEPATLLLFGSGLVFGALTLRRRRSKDSKGGLI